MGRTLYITQTNKPVVIRDGPSLWIKEEGKAGRRIPARYIARAIVIGNVTLNADAIMLLAEHNSPVTFVNTYNHETAILLPYNHRLPVHYKEQQIFLHSVHNIRRYEGWANTKRMLIHMGLVRKFRPALARRLEKTGIGEGNYQEILKELMGVEESKWLVVNGLINELFRNTIVEKLIKAGLDPHTGIIHRRHNYGFALDICYIMGGESDIQTLQFFRSKGLDRLIKCVNGQWNITNKGIRNIVHRFEGRRDIVEGWVEEIMDEIFNLMRELSNEV
jgi:CRISPR/Cas system-associated endonuclease Cas1